jgi:hypothetical protein
MLECDCNPSSAELSLGIDLAQAMQDALHSGLTVERTLAIVSQSVGVCLAMQDPKHAPAYLLDIVKHNIELGNQQACEDDEPVGNC